MRLLVIILLLSPLNYFAQLQSSVYDNLISEAEALSKNKNYKDAARKYEEAFRRNKGLARNKDMYNCIACNAMAGENDSAFVRLNRFVTNTRFENPKKLQKEKRFVPLKKDPRWDSLLVKVAQNKIANKKNLEEAKAKAKESGKAQDQLKQNSAPQTVCKDINGNSFDTEKLRGKVIVLNFWATWCGPCKKEMPELNALRETFTKSDEVVFLSFCNNVDSVARIKEFLLKIPFSYNMVIGEDARKAFAQYAVHAIPLNVIIDKKGKIVFLEKGYAPQIPEAMKEKIEELLKEK